MTHLWEVKHPYYCNEGNYFARGDQQPFMSFETWADFMNEFGDADMDYNLLFRWDWSEGDDDDEVTPYDDDPANRNGKLKLFWMGQRKGLYQWSEVRVCRNDEPAVIEFLKPRLEHLKRLWAPLI